MGNFLWNVILGLRSGLVILYDYAYVWFPIFIVLTFWILWKKYVVQDALSEEDYDLLEIKIPRDQLKSPKAMELFLNNLHQTGGEGNFYDKYWKGGTRPWFSLELVSIGGEVRFYVWTRKKFTKILEQQLYSQFSDAEIIIPAEDYTKKVDFDDPETELFGTMFTLTKDDPYPIKTYVDYGLEQDPKEEFRVDPLASAIEFLGSVGAKEYIWIQILVRAHKKYEKKGLWEKIKKKFQEALKVKEYKSMEDKGKEIIEKLQTEGVPDEAEEVQKKFPRRTKFQEKVIEAIERSLSKPAFDTAIRALYIAEKGVFDKANIGGLMGSFKQYSSDGLNGFKPKKATKFDYPWQDPSGKRLAKLKSKMLRAYLKRANFETRYNIDDFILTTEELATIYHLPGPDIQTPKLPKIDSTKAQPPSNLPF